MTEVHSELVVVYAPDLMDRSRIEAAIGRSAAPQLSMDLVRSPVDLPAASIRPGVVLVAVDLGRPGVLEAIRRIVADASLPVPDNIDSDDASAVIVGFASHVDRELIGEARSAGCGRVMARSAFFSNLDELLAAARTPPS